jgi:WD40 repeat protein
MTELANALVISRDHPWPWLEAFPETASDFFNGRERATEQLLRCVQSAPATVLFGKSGLGKTSLLQAGISPLLRSEQMLPVLVRLTLDGPYEPGRLSGRLQARLDEEVAFYGLRNVRTPLATGLVNRSANDVVGLWELLHDTTTRWLDTEGESWTPVFILDQFEEVFTLIQTAEERQKLFSELGNLIQNRTPVEVAERRKAHDELRKRLDPERIAARFVLSLREDYLADLEVHADRIPRLGPNRYRLLPMTRSDATHAIEKTGGALVDAVDAVRILDFLDKQNLPVDAQAAERERTHPLRLERIEPALLSLVCAGLNQHRIAHKETKLNTDSLDTLGGELLERFYEQALAALQADRRTLAARFIEEELITLDGTRRPFPEKSLGKTGLVSTDIDKLKDMRLLRTENTEQGAYIELVHDRVAEVAKEHATAAEAERARNRQARNRIIGVLTIACVVAFAGVIRQWRVDVRAHLEAQKNAKALSAAATALLDSKKALELKFKEQQLTLARAIDAEAKAASSAEMASHKASEALQAKVLAQAEARDAIAQRMLTQGSDMASLQAVGGQLQGFLTALAGHRIAQSAKAYVQVNSFATLQRLADRNAELRWLRQADAEVNAVAVSPDGAHIVSGSGDNTLRLWDTRTGTAIGESLKGHGDRVLSVAFSPDGARIVSGSADNTLRLWNARTGAAIGEPLKGHGSRVWSAAFSPDGARIASGSADNTLRLWDARTGASIGEPVKGHSGEVNCVAFSPDGFSIVSGSDDATLRLWDARTGAAIGEPLKGHIGSVNSVDFSPDGARIISGGADTTLRLWDARTGAAIGKPLKRHTSGVWAVAFSPDGTRIVSGSADNTLRLWDTRTGTAIGEPLEGHGSTVLSVTFSPDGAHIISGSDDKTVRLWHAQKELAFNDSSKLEHGSTVWSVAFSPDGTRLVSGSDHDTLRVWDTLTGLAIGEPWRGHSGSVLSVAFSPADGARVVSGGSDGTLRLWDAHTGLTVGDPMLWPANAVLSVAFSPDGTRIISGGTDGTLRLWDARTVSSIGYPLEGHRGPVRSVAYSPDGARVVSGSDDGELRLWDAHTQLAIGDPLISHSSRVWSVAFSPQGDRLVSGSSDNTVRLWNARTGARIGEPLKGHVATVRSVAFSPDGARIISGSTDGALRLWDVNTGLAIGKPLMWPGNQVWSVAFSPDGTHIIAGGGDGTYAYVGESTRYAIGEPSLGIRNYFHGDKRIVLLPVLEGWAHALCAKISRNMSRKEWRERVSPEIEYITQCPGKPVPKN